MSEKRIIKLKYPIPVPLRKEDGSEGETVMVDELRLDRPKIKHLKMLPDKVFEEGASVSPMMFIPLIAGLAGIPKASVNEIDLEDLEKLGQEIVSFLPQLQETGEMQS